MPEQSKIQNPKSKIAFLTPLPPTRTGIAHYATLIIPELSRRVELRVFDSLDGYRAEDFDVAIYQLGNNPHHEWIYREALAHPGVIVLHDLVLHHLIVEMTLARGDVEGYVAAMEANHGEAGAAWARGRAAGMHTEMANFLMPASVDVANRSRAVIVHNRWAADRLLSLGVTTPIHVVPHAYVPDRTTHDRDALRARHGFTPQHRVIGFFGFLTSAKRAEVVLEAFRIAQERDPNLRLLIVGEAAPNIDIPTTGYVPDEEFPAYYAAADRLVNLRFPSAGETSGTLIRAFDAGKPVAVSDYAQFAEYPDTCAFKVPFGDREIETLADFFLRDFDANAIANAQREWLEQNATVPLAVDGYLTALTPHDHRPPTTIHRTLPVLITMDVRDHLTLKNTSTATIRTRTYDQPGYRLLAKFFEHDREIHDRWIELPRDLAPGDEVTIDIPRIARATTLRLYHAIEGIPLLEPEPWASLELARGR